MRFKTVMPNTALQALKQWDNGKALATIEISGMSPSYEQLQQCLVFEIIRKWRAWKLRRTTDPKNRRRVRHRFNDIVLARLTSSAVSSAKDSNIDILFEDSLSNRQINGARALAKSYIVDGYAATIKKAKKFRPSDEIIFVTKLFPNYKYVDGEEDNDDY